MEATVIEDAKAISDLLGKISEVQDIYKGNCRGCGECCSRFLPITAEEEFVIGAYVKKHGVEITPPRGDIDLMCPFLNKKKECAIYEVRPEICRVYRCDKHKAKTLPVPKKWERMRTVDMRETFRR